ncbi:MAG: FecR domain-containing protein [Cytophagaceae bacterium]|nr:FecR domain-containing protein [Gemmatimonadaceae bacterium]
MTGPTPQRPTADAPPDWEAIARYVSGESDGAERELVRAWLVANPEDHKLVEALDRIVADVPVELPAGLDIEGALRRTKAAAGGSPILRLEAAAPRLSRFPAARARPQWVVRAFQAAALFGVIAITATIWRYRSEPSPQVATVTTYRASLGKPDSVTLADGSRAILAPGSELAVTATYGTAGREVALRGQGWFRVVHDDARPFVVKAGDAEIRDVGTEFSVNHRANSGVLVQVHEGAVIVRGSSQEASAGVLLHQGDEAVVAQGAVTSTQRGTVPADATAWVSGLLRFRDVPLAEVVETVRRWYGIEIRVDDPALGATKVSIDVNAGSIGGVAQELALTVGGRVDKRGDTLVVRAGQGAR